MEPRIRNREIRKVRVADLQDAEWNFRLHPELQEQALDGIVEDIGFYNYPDVFVTADGTLKLLDGHLRKKYLLKKYGMDAEIEVNVTDFNEAEARKATLTKDPLAALATSSAEQLDGLLKSVDINNDALQELCTKLADEAGLYKIENEPIQDDGEVEIPTVVVVKTGDVWLLGDKPQHRFMCGDSTNQADVAKLLNGNTPHMCVCDPPYGVVYSPSWRNQAAAAGHIQYAARREGEVQNDDRVDWTEAYKLFPGNVLYVWHAGKHSGEVMSNVEAAGFEVRSQIIWKKPHFAISRGHYHWGHEPMVYAVRKGQTSKWVGDRSQSTVWEISNKLDEGDKTEHGTQKPIECMARPIRNHGGPEDGVMDMFAGVFTTGMACEALGRTCYAMDMDQKYVQAGIARWEKLTGKKAVLESTGATLSEMISAVS